MATAKRTSRWRLAAIVGGVSALLLTLTACSQQEVYGQPDEVTCIYNNETGQLDGEPMMPGSVERKVSDQFKVVKIPTSDRFWNISNTPSKDPAAPIALVARDASSKETQTSIEVRFRFNAALACKWYDQHGRRDAVATGGDPQFNINNSDGTPWQKWLNRNFTGLEDSINQDLVAKYSWEYLEYNFPVNADKNGVVPADTEAGLQTLRQIEADFSKALSSKLTAALGAQYFCGIDYNIGGTCTDLLVKITQIKLTDQTPVTNRKALIDQAEANANAQEQARLTQEGTAAAVAANQAKLDQEAQINAANNAAEVLKAQQAAELAAAKQQAALVQAQIDAAVCIATGTSGADCAELIVATKTGTLRAPAGGTVTVNPAPGG